MFFCLIKEKICTIFGVYDADSNKMMQINALQTARLLESYRCYTGFCFSDRMAIAIKKEAICLVFYKLCVPLHSLIAFGV